MIAIQNSLLEYVRAEARLKFYPINNIGTSKINLFTLFTFRILCELSDQSWI